MWRRKRRKTLDQIDWQVPIEEARRLARILVIDDDPDAFPVELLREQGFNIQYWNTIDLDKLKRILNGEFDIIVLDIIGIAPEQISATNGFGVLEEIKRLNPNQLVIAYSGQKFDIKAHDFFSIADDTLGKPTDLVTAASVLDNLLREKFNLSHYWETIRSILRREGIPEGEINRLESRLLKVLESGSTEEAQEFLERLQRKETYVKVAQWISRLISLYLKIRFGI